MLDVIENTSSKSSVALCPNQRLKDKPMLATRDDYVYHLIRTLTYQDLTQRLRSITIVDNAAFLWAAQF